jgi:hypothetical protein
MGVIVYKLERSLSLSLTGLVMLKSQRYWGRNEDFSPESPGNFFSQ